MFYICNVFGKNMSNDNNDKNDNQYWIVADKALHQYVLKFFEENYFMDDYRNRVLVTINDGLRKRMQDYEKMGLSLGINSNWKK